MNDEAATQDAQQTKAGFVSVIGAPNAGKSTLINALVGTKVSIVTHKVQTTRALIRGVGIYDETQIVFIDTPGIFKPKRRLDRAMVTTAWSGARDADVLVLLVDARKGMNEELERIVEGLENVRQPKLLALNKIDLVKPQQLLELTSKLNEKVSFEETFMISALTGDGLDTFLDALTSRMPQGPWLYPEDMVSDLPMRMLAAEITREKLYLRLHQELPYASTVETERWEMRDDGSARVEQTIYVERDSQKKIVIGKKGETIKWISQTARREIMEATDYPVHLFLFVKVRENWANDPERYREMGLDWSE